LAENKKFDTVRQGYEYYIDENGNRRMRRIDDSQDIIKAVKTAKVWTPSYQGQDAYFRIVQDDIDIAFAGEFEPDGEYTRIEIPADTMFQTMVSRASNTIRLDDFMINEAFVDQGFTCRVGKESEDHTHKAYQFTLSG